MMKNKYKNFDDEDEEVYPIKGKQQEHRRPIRNWKKVWNEHEDDYDELDYLHNK